MGRPEDRFHIVSHVLPTPSLYDIDAKQHVPEKQPCKNLGQKKPSLS